MVDWELPSGRTVRVEAIPIFCANCGTSGGFVPKENTTFACYLCRPCSDAYGEIAGTMMIPDEIFFAKVGQELLEHFGHTPSAEELLCLAEQGWGPLAKLVQESPIPN